MRRLFILFFLFLSILAVGQPGPKGKLNQRPIVITDSMVDILKKQSDSITHLRKQQEMKEFSETNQRNLDSFLRARNEQRAREKRNAMVRIAIGVVLLIVLVIGLRRRKSMSK